MKLIIVFRSLIFISAFLIFPSCIRKNNKAQYKPVITECPKTVYIKFNDVECDLCAQSCVDALSALDSINSCVYEQVNNNYEDGYLKVELKPQCVINKQEICQKLQDCGFEVTEIIEK